jgi:ElaB/YqjD/DUF883 family membrane-anchored ribosome-binding protein
MKQATANKDKHAWKRWPWADIAFASIIGAVIGLFLALAPAGWWL